MNEILSIATLNSRIKFDKTDIPFTQREIMGDATETGLSRFAGRYVEDYDAYIKMYPKMFEVPFNSTNKWALTLVSPSRLRECSFIVGGRENADTYATGKQGAR